MDQTSFRPRAWQEESLGRCLKHYRDGGSSFLLVACPGAGKTVASLTVAAEFLKQGWIKRIVIVTPSIALRKQWVRKCHEVGIDAITLRSMKALEQGMLPLGVAGLVLSYQQINQPNFLAAWIAETPTLVIFDEIHHCAESKSWGESVHIAFRPATYRLALSGTPFREDSFPIPFVYYHERTHECVADHTYGYEQAIREGHCRPVEFPWFDGLHEWVKNGDKFAYTFDDELPDDLSSERLMAATDAHTDTVERMVRAADTKLSEIRAMGGYHAASAGLCIGRNDAHVHDLTMLIKRISGEEPVIVHQKIEDAQQLIQDFAGSEDRWIVAIKMVSEGIDIPRLRVGLYASNIRKSLFFRQFVGRFVRVIQDAASERAYIFMPGDPTLKDIAEAIEREKCHALGIEYQRGLVKGDPNHKTRSLSEFRVSGSDGDFRATIASGKNISAEELQRAAFVRAKDPSMFVHVTNAQLATILRSAATSEPPCAA